MDVIHKTFPGGYKFGVFKGQPSKEIKKFIPTNVVKASELGNFSGNTAVDVLNALGHTVVSGPSGAFGSEKGTIKSSLVKEIVVSAVEVEPYSLSTETLLNEKNKKRFLDGLKSLNESYGKAKLIIILGDNQTELLNTLTQELGSFAWIDLVSITAKYPANLKEISIPAVLGKKYPVGYSPASIGVLFLSVKDVILVTQLLKEKVLSTYVALSGTGWKENVVLEVPVGTAISEIKEKYIDEGENRLIKNSVLTEVAFGEDDKLGFDTSVIIALPEDRTRRSLFFLRGGKKADSFSNSFVSSLFSKEERISSTNVNGERRNCVSCTYCQEVCPVEIIPHLIHKHVEKKLINVRLAEYRIFDCIECGLCDYVCPSKIEISTDIKSGKARLEELEISHMNYIIPYCNMIVDAKGVGKDE